MRPQLLRTKIKYWLIACCLLSFPLESYAKSSVENTGCTTTPSVPCLLTKSLELSRSISSKTEREKVLIELGFESYFFGEKKAFKQTLQELKKSHPTKSESLPEALQQLSQLLSTKKHALPPESYALFSDNTLQQLSKEEIFLQSINDQNIKPDQINKYNIRFHDSLQWRGLDIDYLNSIRNVDLKKSTQLKRTLVQQLVQLPPEQHKQHNLDIALIEILGGALKQGEETRLKSDINGFNNHQLTLLNQRIIFYQKFIKYYNTHVGLQKKQCDTPTPTISNSFSTFFTAENQQLIEELDTLSAKKPNDYLIAGAVIKQLNPCTPLSNFFLQRYLQVLSTLASPKTIIRHLRSLRRYT